MIVDGHCDVLWKLFQDKRLKFDADDSGLQAGLSRLKKGGVKLQFFAIYISEEFVGPPTFDHALSYIDLFYRQVAAHPEMAAVRCKEDLQSLLTGDSGHIGALLTMEGSEALNGDPLLLRTAYRLGVRAIGLTWNYANWAGDGAKEPRQSGLTHKGKKFVRDCNELGMLLDVSHLSERSFWDLAEVAGKPFFASHSNIYDLCPHPRNLKKDQVRTIIARGGIIGLNFIPFFVVSGRQALMDDLLRHMEYICELGGTKHGAIGSDFDGADEKTIGLEHAGCFDDLANALHKHYAPDIANGFLHENWISFLRQNLPNGGSL